MNVFETTAPARRTHRPLLGICVCFILGIVINEYTKIPAGFYFLLTMALLVLSVLTRRKISIAFLLVSIIFLGAGFSGNHQTFPADHISQIPYSFRKATVLVEGVVVSDVERRPFFKGKKTTFTLEVKRIKSPRGWKQKSGTILVNFFREEELHYGDYLVVEGKLHRPFNFANDVHFSYREYLFRKGISYILSVKKTGALEVLWSKQGNVIKDASLRIKHRLSQVIKTYLPKQEAGIMQAFLLGDRYDIPQGVYDLFKISGVAHIVAISGFNIGIVAYMIFLMLKMFPVPRVWQYFLTMVLLIFYAFLTGGQPPVVRATIMAVVFLTSFLIERESEPINSLAGAALILLLMNPLNLFDVGFQLSFISVLFIILFYSPLTGMFYKFFPGEQESLEEDQGSPGKDGVSAIRFYVIRYILQSTALTLSAYLGVVVLIAYYFQIVTPVVIAANLVIIPLASLIIFLGMGLLVAGVVFPFMAFAFANCTTVLLNVMIASVFFFSQIPGAYVPINNFPLSGVFYYYGLAALIWGGWSLMKKLNFFSKMPKAVN